MVRIISPSSRVHNAEGRPILSVFRKFLFRRRRPRPIRGAPPPPAEASSPFAVPRGFFSWTSGRCIPAVRRNPCGADSSAGPISIRRRRPPCCPSADKSSPIEFSPRRVPDRSAARVRGRVARHPRIPASGTPGCGRSGSGSSVYFFDPILLYLII
jgi:hypothetical protein